MTQTQESAFSPEGLWAGERVVLEGGVQQGPAGSSRKEQAQGHGTCVGRKGCRFHMGFRPVVGVPGLSSRTSSQNWTAVLQFWPDPGPQSEGTCFGPWQWLMPGCQLALGHPAGEPEVQDPSGANETWNKD